MPRSHFRFALLLTLLLGLFGAGAASAQVSTNVFTFTYTPSTNTVLIADTTNTLNVTIANNTDFSNLVVSAAGGSLSSIFVQTTPTSGVFNAKLITPTNGGLFTVDLTITGIDLTATNLVPTPTNNVILTTNFTLGYNVVTRPPNDNFANAYIIPAQGGTAYGTNNWASLESGEPQHGGDPTASASVWWVWTPPVSESVLIDTAGSSFPPVLGVYTGGAVDALKAVASSTNDVVDNLKANVVFQTVAGQAYYIAVAGWSSATTTNNQGSIELRVVPGGLPDTNPPQLTITAPEANLLTSTNRVVLQGVAKDDGPNDTGVASVYVQVNGGPEQLAFNSTNGTPSTSWTLPVTLPLGENSITARAVDLAGNVSVPYAIVVNYMYPPNTLFSDATVLSGLSGTVFDNTTNAVSQPGEPLIGGSLGSHTVWWTFLAPEDGILTLTTAGSSFNTVLGLFSGNNLTNLTSVSSNAGVNSGLSYSALTSAVSSNVLYDIAVDGYAGATGSVMLTYTFTPGSATNAAPTFYSVTALAETGGSVSGGGSYVSNSLVTLTASASSDYAFSAWQGGAGLGTSTANPLVIPNLKSNETWTALFVVTNFTDSFQGGSLTNVNWVSSGNLPWLVESTNVPADAIYAARSGPITDSQSSSLSLATNTASGTGSFAYLVSSEAGWDWLQFYTNGVLAMEWSGQTVTNWSTYSFPVAAGNNTFEFTYVKDPTISLGMDAGFIANFYIPLATASTVTSNSPAFLTLVSAGPPSQISLLGQVAVTYVLQASGDLANWANISTNVGASSAVLITDSQSGSYPIRFYRAVAGASGGLESSVSAGAGSNTSTGGSK